MVTGPGNHAGVAKAPHYELDWSAGKLLCHHQLADAPSLGAVFAPRGGRGCRPYFLRLFFSVFASRWRSGFAQSFSFSNDKRLDKPCL